MRERPQWLEADSIGMGPPLRFREEMEEEDGEHEIPKSRIPSKGPSGDPKGARAPSAVKPVPRLSGDLRALQRLFCNEEPPQCLVRGQLIHEVKYAFGDASEAGFGSSWISADSVRYRFGTWGRDMDNGSSNLRELKNLVDTLRKMAESNELEGSEIFIFTDNSTVD